MTQLGEMLLKKKEEFPDEELILFKSDISDAYRHLPMHPLWQVKQINTIEKQRHVDRRNCFGGKGSGSLFVAFNSLVTWVGKNVCHVTDLGTYSDDSFGVELAKNVTFYKPYSRFMPTNQVKLLTLWDRLGIPHKEKKQLFGPKLTIIGIEVDANNLTLTLPEQNKLELISNLENFARTPEKSGVRYSLREFQHLAGWFNWALNVYPLLNRRSPTSTQRWGTQNQTSLLQNYMSTIPFDRIYSGLSITSDDFQGHECYNLWIGTQTMPTSSRTVMLHSMGSDTGFLA